MKNSKIYGLILIVGTLGGLITMLVHPTSHDLLSQPDEIARRNELITVAAHSLAIISIPMIFFGFLGFSRRLGLENPLVTAALVAYGFGSAAVMFAAAINGLAGPALTRKIIESDEQTRQFLHVILMNNGLLNQAFDKIYVVAVAVALIAWSICLLPKNGRLTQITAGTGFTIGLLGMLGIFTGNLRLDVHGFGLFVIAQSVWAILVADLMIRRESNITES